MINKNRSAAASAAVLKGLARAVQLAIALTTAAHVGPAAADSQAALFEAANRAAEEQRLGDMETIYRRIVQYEPANVRALSGLAAAQAWQGDYLTAQRTYKQALAVSPADIDTRVGLGYAYAWNGQYTHAHTEFNRVLADDPTNLSARKGIAYSYLWSDEYGFALETLDIAASIAPDDAEIWEAQGQANLLQGRNNDAIENFDRALQLQPDRQSARFARSDAYRSAPMLEATAIAGSTSGASSGLRQLEVAHWTSRSTRLALRYDNSLGLDTPSLVDRDENAHSYFVSAGHRFKNQLTVVGEAGRRRLAGGDQNVVALQGFFETSLASVRIGGQFADHEQGYNDTLAFAGVRFPVADKWYLEPTIYVAETGVAGDAEWRAVLNAEHQLRFNLSLGALAGAGSIDAEDNRFDGDTQLYGAWLRFDLEGRCALTLMLRRESTPTRDFTVAELGFTLRLPGNRGL